MKQVKNRVLRSWHLFLGSILLIAISGFQGTLIMNTSGRLEIQAFSEAQDIPILKGLSDNPVLKIILSVPSGKKELALKKLVSTINLESVQSILRLDVYLTGAEPFSPNHLIGSISPSSRQMEIPVNLQLKPGVRFIWVSVVLKDDAGIDGKINLRCSRFIDENGGEIPIRQQGPGKAFRTGIAIRKSGDDHVNTFRIPGIAQTDKGTLLAVYDIRYDNSRDLPGNIDVGLSRSTDLGKTWEPMRVILDMGQPRENNGVGDPSILYDPVTKTTWVAGLWSKGNHSIAGSIGGISPDSTGQLVLVMSTDDGLSWSSPINITAQVKNPDWKLFFQGPGSGIAMQDGTLVFAAQYWDEKGVPYSTIIYSDDHGISWKGKLAGPKSNTTESQVVETRPGTLMLNMRDNRGRFRSVATTSDLGATWTEHLSSYNALPDPVCMASLIKVNMNLDRTKKDILFFSNPNSSSGRHNITIKASLDFGSTWLPANQVLIDERPCFGYSSLVQVDENTIGILYEGIKDLYFVKVPVGEIIK